MDDKVKYLLKWIEISKEKADDTCTRLKKEGETSKALLRFGEGNAFSACEIMVKKIFEV